MAILEKYREQFRIWKEQSSQEPHAWSVERKKYIDLLLSECLEDFWFLIKDNHPLFCSLFVASEQHLLFQNDVNLSEEALRQFCLSLPPYCEGNAFLKELFQEKAWDRIILDGLGNKPFSKSTDAAKKMVVDVSLRCMKVPAETFMMGALDREEWGHDDEKPRHEVTLTKGFHMGMYPCTQALYEHVVGENPSQVKASARPVERVSWCDAILFCNKLSELEGLEPCYDFPHSVKNQRDWMNQVEWNRNANGYRLPTEAEWEYCARAGQDTIYSGSDNLDEVGWYKKNSDQQTQPVGRKKANAFGLYDMSGNVWEWTFDTSFGKISTYPEKKTKYPKTPRTDPFVEPPSAIYSFLMGPETNRVTRGGSSQNIAQSFTFINTDKRTDYIFTGDICATTSLGFAQQIESPMLGCSHAKPT